MTTPSLSPEECALLLAASGHLDRMAPLMADVSLGSGGSIVNVAAMMRRAVRDPGSISAPELLALARHVVGDEASEPVAPRTWREGDEQPENVTRVTDRKGLIWKRLGGSDWSIVDAPTRFEWGLILKLFGPLTETPVEAGESV